MVIAEIAIVLVLIVINGLQQTSSGLRLLSVRKFLACRIAKDTP